MVPLVSGPKYFDHLDYNNHYNNNNINNLTSNIFVAKSKQKRGQKRAGGGASAAVGNTSEDRRVIRSIVKCLRFDDFIEHYWLIDDGNDE